MIVGGPQIFGQVSGFGFATRGSQLSVDLIRNRPNQTLDFQLGPVIGVNLDRTNRVKDEQVKALGKLKAAVEAGAYIGVSKTGVITSDFDTLTVGVTAVHDVSKGHRSYVISPSISYLAPLSRKALVLVSLDASYAGKGYARTYFGVDALGSLRSGLPVFSPKAGWKNYSITAAGSYSLSGDLRRGLALVAGASYGRLLNDSARSPITSIAGQRDQWLGGAGLTYTF